MLWICRSDEDKEGWGRGRYHALRRDKVSVQIISEQ